MKRVMVDMSATIIHHGHVRLIQQAAQHGDVVIGLTTDEQIQSCKGYAPELAYEHRREILESIRDVAEVVPTPWLITEEVLEQHRIDLLVHGHDNSNPVNESRLLVLPRTEGVSSTVIRQRAQRSITCINNQKLMLTPGPAVVLHENLQHIKPLFGRGDGEYQEIARDVLGWIKGLAGQDEVVALQGSATLALELAAHSFVSGDVLLVTTGYYSARLETLLPPGCRVTKTSYDELDEVTGSYDWLLCAYTETSHAFKSDLRRVREKADVLGALLYADATGSIGLEEGHELCDLIAFSSCKGLFGLTGAGFIAYKKNLQYKASNQFYFNLQTHRDKLVTGPYHAVASLYGLMENHGLFRERVRKSKAYVLDTFPDLVNGQDNQPLLCTYVEGRIIPGDDRVVPYSPRSDLPGSVICHFGEIHKPEVELGERIKVLPLG